MDTNTGSGGITSVSDGVNSYASEVSEQTANSFTLSVWCAVNCSPVNSSITVNLPASGNVVIVRIPFGSSIDKKLGNTSSSSISTGTLSSQPEVLLGASWSSVSAPTKPSTWTQINAAVSGGNPLVDYLVVTATTSVTYNPTNESGSDVANALVSFLTSAAGAFNNNITPVGTMALSIGSKSFVTAADLGFNPQPVFFHYTASAEL